MHEINLGKKNRFLKQFIYYILRFFAEKNKKKMQIAGFSFDSIFLRINIDGTYEKDEIDFLKKFLLDKLSSKICALDIGANIGNHTIRLFSKMFSEVYCFYLKDIDSCSLYIPEGFAHAYYRYEKINIIYYKLTNYYMPKFEDGINLMDKTLKVAWPKKKFNVSKKDKNLQGFKEFCRHYKFL